MSAKVLFDSSVIVAGLVSSHAAHVRAFEWLRRAQAGEIQPVVCSHSLAETYSVLTSLPLKPRIAPADAARLWLESIKPRFGIISLAASDYHHCLAYLMERNLSGGLIYNALIFQAARKSGAQSLLTLNAKDFRRLWRDGDPDILEP